MNTSRVTGARAGSGSRSTSARASRSSGTSPTAIDDPSSSTDVSESAPTAPSLMDDFADTARTATRAVQNQASELGEQIGHELTQVVDQQKSRGVEALYGFAHAIETAADQLENQSPQAARYVRDVAERVEGLSQNISSRDVRELLQAASDMARAQPILFCGGAIAAGFALSRFLKSSARTGASDVSGA